MHTADDAVGAVDPADDPGAARRPARSARARAAPPARARVDHGQGVLAARPRRALLERKRGCARREPARARPQAARRAVPFEHPGRRCAPLPQRPDPRRRLRVGAEAVAGRAARASRRLARASGRRAGRAVRGDPRSPPRAGGALPKQRSGRRTITVARSAGKPPAIWPPRAGGRSAAATWPSRPVCSRAPPR